MTTSKTKVAKAWGWKHKETGYIAYQVLRPRKKDFVESYGYKIVRVEIREIVKESTK